MKKTAAKMLLIIVGHTSALVLLTSLGPAPAAAQDVRTATSGNATGVNNSDEPPDDSPRGFLGIIFAGGWVGFLIVMLLFALSLTAAYLVFEHVMTLRTAEIMPPGLGDQVRTSLVAGHVAEAEQACRAQPSFLSFVLLSAIAELDGGWSAVEKALEDATAEQSARLFRKIEYLSVIGNIAPMVGLLGTVTGMIFAFQQVASTQGAAGAGQLAEGIYQALVTTVGGLLVAIPSLGAFAIFRNRVDQLVAEAAYLAQHAFSPLKRRRSSSRSAAASQRAAGTAANKQQGAVPQPPPVGTPSNAGTDPPAAPAS